MVFLDEQIFFFKLKNISEGMAPANSLSYQRLPDASPQHHPTHSLKVHRNTKPSHWGGRAREREWNTVEGEEEGKRRRIAWKHSEGKVDHGAEEGRLEQREAGEKCIGSVKDPSLSFPTMPERLKTKERRKNFRWVLTEWSVTVKEENKCGLRWFPRQQWQQ